MCKPETNGNGPVSWDHLFQVVPSAVFTVDKEQKITSWNKAAERITGYSADEIVGKECSIFAKSPCCNGCRLFDESLKKPLEGITCNIITKDGRELVIEKNADLLEKDGAVLGGVESFVDITDRKKMEAVVSENQQFVQSIIDTSPSLVYIYDLTTQSNIYANRKITELLGYTPEDILAMGAELFVRIIHPDDLGSVITNQEKLMGLKDGELTSIEYRMKTKDDEWRWFLSTELVFKRDEEGVPIHKLGTAIDITDRKKSELVLSQSKALEEAAGILDNMGDGLIVLDMTGKILQVNKAILNMMELEEKDLVGSDTLSVLSKQIDEEELKRVMEILQTTLVGGKHEAAIMHLNTPDGRTVPISFTSSFMLNEKDQPYRIITTVQDITAIEQVKESLEKNWENVKTMIDSIPEVLYVTDPETNEVLLVNKFFEDILGSDPVGKKCYEAFQGFDKPCDFCTNEIIKKNPGPYIWEYHNPLLDMDFYISDQLIKWPDGRDVRFELAVNITEKKKAEMELLWKNKAFESSIAAISTASPDGNLNHVNQAFLDLWGYDTFDEVLGKPISHFFAKQEETGPVMDSLMSTDEWKGEFTGLKKDGATFITSAFATVLKNEKGELVGFMSTNVDVTLERKAEEKILEEKNFSDNIINSLPGIFYMFGPDGKFIRWNENFEKVSGYSSDEVAANNPIDYFEGEDQEIIQKAITQVFETGSGDALADFVIKDGKNIAYYFTGRLVQIDGLPFLVGSGIDISRRVESEAVRDQLITELERTNKELEQIVYVTSHDLRSPLVNIQGFSNELGFSMEELKSIIYQTDDLEKLREASGVIIDKDVPEFQSYIQTSIGKMDALLAGLLKISRVGRATLQPEKLHMDQMLEEITANFKYRLNDSNIELKVEDVPDCVGDQGQINQVFSNLVDNAIKYNDPSKMGSIKITGEKKGNRAVYCIEDNGKGFDMKHVDRVFDIFHRLAPNDSIGEGLGLAIVYRILDRHGGRVWAESESGKGTKFFVELPTELSQIEVRK